MLAKPIKLLVQSKNRGPKSLFFDNNITISLVLLTFHNKAVGFKFSLIPYKQSNCRTTQKLCLFLAVGQEQVHIPP